ncbi:hypothetical protein [Methanothermobacter marburgensis]|uniref:hypothetical protein n=1 Tax=Methanothermobacter marburgensis TaxID=145263 RepID=UPI0035B9971A
MLIILILSLFILGCVSADAENNTTANITSGNQPIVEPLATGVKISVDPASIDLGTVEPDGIEREYYTATKVTIRTTGGTLRFSVRANSNLVSLNNSSNIIPISNLRYSIKYDGPYGPIIIPKRSFTTSHYQIWTYKGSDSHRLLPHCTTLHGSRNLRDHHNLQSSLIKKGII